MKNWIGENSSKIIMKQLRTIERQNFPFQDRERDAYTNEKLLIFLH